MKKLIVNANIITMNEPFEIRGGYIGIDGDVIDYVDVTEPFGYEDADVIDAEDAIVMPGLVNAHTHIPMTLFRGVADDVDLHEWLFDHIFPLESKLTPEDVYRGSKLALEEMIATGTTCFCDMYFKCGEVINATKRVGLRANIGTGLSCKESNIDFASDKDILEFNSLEGDDKIKISVNPHAVYTNSPEFLQYCLGLGDLFHIHISETLQENIECMDRFGKTPTKFFYDLGYLRKEKVTNCAHCVYLTEEDMFIFAQNDVSITHCPSSNLKLASGIAPIHKYLAAGINIALGTDGAASNNSLDMFNEIRLAALIHKGVRKDPLLVTAKTALEMATVNGAKALGRGDEIGKIAKGYKADIIFIETKSANMMPLGNSLCSTVVYAAGSKNVVRTMVGGETIYRKEI